MNFGPLNGFICSALSLEKHLKINKGKNKGQGDRGGPDACKAGRGGPCSIFDLFMTFYDFFSLIMDEEGPGYTFCQFLKEFHSYFSKKVYLVEGDQK